MQVHVNTDHNIAGHEPLTAHVRGAVQKALSHFSEHITRVDVHLSDENGDKPGPNDKRCSMEAHLEGHQPFVVTHHASTAGEAADGAAGELARLIEHTLGRLQDQERSRTDPR
jgi:hypothetical protein